MFSLISVSASKVVVGDVADKFKLPCQRVHTVTVAVCRRPDLNQCWLTPATDLDQSATTFRQLNIGHHVSPTKWYFLEKSRDARYLTKT